ncbi:MAG: class I SAM-dependent methyltransferase [Thermodesulfobacteriota bacterium]
MSIPSSYDRAPYDSKPAASCHIDRLCTLGRLFGLSPAPVEPCRVLDLGCAEGGHLIPMAVNLPRSEFLGLDLSRKQIETGRGIIAALGVKNIALEPADLMAVDDSFGRFDYIICHGVYSWAPPEVQEKIFRIGQANLAPQGVAYVDYNTYPGWFMLETIRDLMRFHLEGLDDPEEGMDQALFIAEVLARYVGAESEYARCIRSELEHIVRAGRSPFRHALLYHEYLEGVNRPLYFHEFVRRAAAYGLQYLGEADAADMHPVGFPDRLIEVLSGLKQDQVRYEQYLDFLCHRRFRRTLLCREGLVVDRDIKPADIPGFLAAATTGLTLELVEQTEVVPLAKAALIRLLEKRPRAVKVGPLLDEALARLEPAPAGPDERQQARLAAAADFIRFYHSNMIQLLTWQADFTLSPGPRPRLNPLAALQAGRGQAWLTNQVHEPVLLPPPLMALAKLLDGRRDRAALAGLLGLGNEEALDPLLSQIAAKALLVA